MRDNKLKRMLREGKVALGASAPFKDPDSVEFLGYLGYDFVFIDGEHGSLGQETIGTLVRAAQRSGHRADGACSHQRPCVDPRIHGDRRLQLRGPPLQYP